MKLSMLVKMDSSARRLKEILAIFGKYGLADWMQGIQYDWLQQWLTSPDGRKISELSQATRIRLAMTELGPTFIKLGQILSTRADLVGPEIADELKQLQSSTPPDSPEEVRATIEDQFSTSPEELYAAFKYEALASASIGQVHEATLHDGREVIVKVQHAGIEQTIQRDLDILAGLAELAERHSSQLRAFSPVSTSVEFRRTLLRELDFTREKRNLQQFARNFDGNPTVHFPTVSDDLSTLRVLTMERLNGIPVSDRDQLVASGEDLSQVAECGARMYLDMVFRDGFYHADPHPGNLLLLPDGVVGVLDCGMVGRIDEQLREDFEGMLLAAVAKDAEDLTDYVIRLGSVPNDFDHDALRSEIGDFVSEYVGQTLREFDLSGALNGMTEIIRRYNIVLPSSASMLLKVLVMLEGTSRQLDPNFSLAELLQPYYKEAAKRRFAPQKLLNRSRRAFRDWDRLLGVLPRDLNDVLGRIRRGNFDVNLQHRRLDSTVNRLVLGIITAALFVGSAELWANNVLPFRGLSVPGILGCSAAIFLGWRLLRAIKRSDNLEHSD